MAKIKSFTDLQQSEKLAKILPLDSADMYYNSGDECDICFGNGIYEEIADWLSEGTPKPADIPCWSLSALLDVLPKTIDHETLFIETSPALWHIGYRNVYTARTDNPVDACYKLVLKLNELNLL